MRGSLTPRTRTVVAAASASDSRRPKQIDASSRTKETASARTPSAWTVRDLARRQPSTDARPRRPQTTRRPDPPARAPRVSDPAVHDRVGRGRFNTMTALRGVMILIWRRLLAARSVAALPNGARRRPLVSAQQVPGPSPHRPGRTRAERCGRATPHCARARYAEGDRVHTASAVAMHGLGRSARPLLCLCKRRPGEAWPRGCSSSLAGASRPSVRATASRRRSSRLVPCQLPTRSAQMHGRWSRRRALLLGHDAGASGSEDARRRTRRVRRERQATRWLERAEELRLSSRATSRRGLQRSLRWGPLSVAVGLRPVGGDVTVEVGEQEA
jgi:hypothetical protein